MRFEVLEMNAGAELPPVSLIICSRGRPKLLIETVESILDGDEVPQELIMIDQSEDENRVLAGMSSDRCGLRYVHMERTGVSLGGMKAYAWRGTSCSSSPTTTCSWSGRGSARSSERSLRRVSAASSSGGCWPASPSRKAHSCGIRTISPPHRLRRQDTRTSCTPTNAAFYRSSIEAVGLYDERLGPGARFPCGEDNDLAFRLLESGIASSTSRTGRDRRVGGRRKSFSA